MPVFLRPLKHEDVTDEYLSWFSDETVTEYLAAKNLARQQVIDYMDEGRASKRWFMYAIVDEESGLHIGNVKIGDIDLTHRVSDLVTVIGNRGFWRKGLAEQAIRLGNKLAFDKYDIRKLTGGIIEGNEGSIKAYTRAGWSIEARLKGNYIVDGETRDRIVVSCFNPSYFP